MILKRGYTKYRVGEEKKKPPFFFKVLNLDHEPLPLHFHDPVAHRGVRR